MWAEFAEQIFYHPGDIGQGDDFAQLAAQLDRARRGSPISTRVYYLATAPQFYEPAVEQLGAPRPGRRNRAARGASSSKNRSAPTWPPPSSSTQSCTRSFSEQQVYRIDHYLGKETVQNLLVLRFANTIFEPIWNRNYIDHVQITVAEEVDVGSRAGYYDTAGVLRDMFQNHLLQLLMITAMEAPVRYEADASATRR